MLVLVCVFEYKDRDRMNGTNYTLRSFPSPRHSTLLDRTLVVAIHMFSIGPPETIPYRNSAVNVWRRLSVKLIDILTFGNSVNVHYFLTIFGGDDGGPVDYNYFI